jgi:hypothetical protein
MLLSSPKLTDTSQLEMNIKSLKMITETRIHPLLAEPRMLDMCLRILKSAEHSNKIKITIMQGLTACSRQLLHRKRVLQTVLPDISRSLVDFARKKEEDEEYLAAIVRLCIGLAGNFQRKVFIPGETR